MDFHRTPLRKPGRPRLSHEPTPRIAIAPFPGPAPCGQRILCSASAHVEHYRAERKTQDEHPPSTGALVAFGERAWGTPSRWRLTHDGRGVTVRLHALAFTHARSCLALLPACAPASVRPATAGSAAATASRPATTPPAVATPAPTERTTSAPATPPPTLPPAPIATVAPTPGIAVAPMVATDLCGAVANPWGYNFCGRGSTISSPPSNFCTYFNCIATFWRGRGYAIQCRDGTYGKSGGISGSCSGHGGNSRALTG